jgi:hypothetical protein
MNMSGQLHVPVDLPPGINTSVATVEEAGGPQSQSGGHGKEKILVPARY